jgi:hypothetical protein
MEESLWSFRRTTKTTGLREIILLNCYIVTSYSKNYMNNSW